METKQLEIIQKVGIMMEDGTFKIYLFQPKVAPNGESKFEIIKSWEGKKIPQRQNYVMQIRRAHDDLTGKTTRFGIWVYGPTAQKWLEGQGSQAHTFQWSRLPG